MCEYDHLLHSLISYSMHTKTLATSSAYNICIYIYNCQTLFRSFEIETQLYFCITSEVSAQFFYDFMKN